MLILQLPVLLYLYSELITLQHFCIFTVTSFNIILFDNQVSSKDIYIDNKFTFHKQRYLSILKDQFLLTKYSFISVIIRKSL